MIKLIGSILVFSGCGGFGFALAFSHRRKARFLEHIKRVLSVMECELRYRLTPLPELCMIASRETDGALEKLLQNFSKELDRRLSPDAASCMSKVLKETQLNDPDIRNILMQLSRTLGRFDLNGQLEGIDHVRSVCTLEAETLRRGKTERIRCYQTLGLCAGAALVIILV